MIQNITQFIHRHSQVNWVMADQAMVSGVNFLTGILLARFLGIEEFGRFSLVWMVVLFISSIHNAAIIAPMMSIGPKLSEEESPKYFGAILIQLVALGGGMSILLFAGSHLFNGLFPEWEMSGIEFPLAFTFLGSIFQDTLRSYFFTKQQASRAFLNDAVRYLGQLLVLISLFTSSQVSLNTNKVLWVIGIMALAATALGLFFVARVEFDKTALNKTVQRHWNFSKWLIGSAVMFWVTGNFFPIVLGAVLGTTAVGAYKAAQNLVGVMHILMMGMNNFVPVKAAHHYHTAGIAGLKNYLSRVMVFALTAATFIALVLSFDPALWLRLIFGEQFIEYGFIVRWFSVLYIFHIIELPFRYGLRAMEWTYPIFYSFLIAAVFSILSAWPLIWSLGILGALVGTLAGHILMIITLWRGFFKRIMTVEYA